MPLTNAHVTQDIDHYVTDPVGADLAKNQVQFNDLGNGPVWATPTPVVTLASGRLAYERAG